MSVSAQKWADMTAEERKAYKAERAKAAFAKIEAGEYPTGIPGPVIGKLLSMLPQKDGIARPTGETGTGGVSYSIPRGVTVTAGGKTFRFNNLSVSILGDGQSAGRQVQLPEGVQEDLLDL